MNFAQNLNIGSRLVIMSAFAFGLIEAVKQYDIGNYKDDDDVYSLLILSAFIVLFTLKSSLDDHKYFGEVFQDKLTSRYIGLILAFFSWIFFTIGAYFIYSQLDQLNLWGFLCSFLLHGLLFTCMK